MIKNVVYFIPTFSHFFLTADDYQFSSKAADFRILSVRTKRLFTVIVNNISRSKYIFGKQQDEKYYS